MNFSKEKKQLNLLLLRIRLSLTATVSELNNNGATSLCDLKLFLLFFLMQALFGTRLVVLMVLQKFCKDFGNW